MKKQIYKRFKINDIVIIQTIEDSKINCYVGSLFKSDAEIVRTEPVNINKIKYIFNL